MTFIFLCFALIQPPALAQLDVHQQQGLKDTQEFLKNKEERQQWVDKNQKAKDVDKKVDAFAGTGENKEEIYSISADIMEKITKETKGDPKAMQKLLEQAEKNPRAFYEKYFDDKSKARVRGVANKIEKRGSSRPSPK